MIKSIKWFFRWKKKNFPKILFCFYLRFTWYIIKWKYTI